MRTYISIFLLFLGTTAFAQNGKITGKVISSKSGEPLIGATVTIERIKRSVATDLNGTYTLGGLPAGTYSVMVSFISYGKKSVDDVAVKAGEVVSLNISLDEAATASDEVIVKSTRVNRENASTVLTAQKNSASVSDGISAEAIRKTPDRNTSDVLKRVSGASIQDDRFVIIRGLGDRYNAAFINGAPLPSSESDRKAFAFDIFPSNILDNLVIYKTATPDMSGEFGGGVINISTKSIPSKNFTSISFGLGFNTLATFKDKTFYKGGKWDFIGLDDGTRKLPSEMPGIDAFDAISSLPERANYAKFFKNNWLLENKKALPYTSVQFAKGLNIERKGKEFAGMLFSINYNRNPTYSEGEKQSHDYDRSSPGGLPNFRNNFSDKIYSDKTLLGALANFSLKLGSKSTLNWKNIFSINAEDRVLVRQGNNDFQDDPTSVSKVNGRWFTSNTIFSTQLIGNHVLNKSNLRLDWTGAFSRVKRSIPDLRQSVYNSNQSTDFYADVNTSRPSPDNGGTHFYSTNDEKISSIKLDLTQPFVFKTNKQNQLKLGFYYQKRVRDFTARLLGFYLDTFDPDLLKLPEDKIFAPENLGFTIAGNKRGFGITDGSKPSYNYDASSSLTAGYAMLDQRFGKKIRLIYGLRLENFDQKLNSFDNSFKKVNINTTQFDVLPSANLVYSLDAKQNLRFSYSKTLNRPEFRELAPFLFFDFVTRYNVEGDTTLQRAVINNYDLRYEFYPGRAQLFSFSGFYKNFTNPIELISSANSNNTASYQNAQSAKIYGVEAEVRSLLGTLFHTSEKSIFDKITWSANAALIWSKIVVNDKNLGGGGSVGKDGFVQNRALQGQSPYLFNTSFAYSNDESGVSATISANRVGPRLYIVGNLADVDIYEQGRTVLDFQAAKMFQKGKWELRLNIKDILAQKQIFFYDINQSKKYEEAEDRKFIVGTFGQTISISATYKF